MVAVSTYSIAPRGLATSFTEAETPVEYALKFRNRYINAAGGAEKRQGISQLGSTISGTPTITAIHELVLASGTTVLFVSGAGVIYRLSGSTFSSVHSGLDSSAVLQSVQMGKKLIFVNGVDRAIWTEDGTTFETLRPIIEKGETTTGTDDNLLRDSGVTNWLNTEIAVNDILWNRTKDAYAIITVVASTSVEHTVLGTAATGIGVSTVGNQVPGDRYEIWDTLELNIIPTDGDDDNVATLTSGANATSIYVSGLSFSDTEVRAGDWVHNTTRQALTRITSVSANLVVTSVANQTVGDSVTFFKSAVPLSTYAHVHYNRLYLIDERDQTQVAVSGPRDPQNWTTNAGTIDSMRIAAGALQPDGDVVIAMKSFQRFLALFGKRNAFLFEGTDPVASTAASTTDFSIVGMFPQGLISKTGVASLGNDLVFATHDGVQSITMVDDASNLNRENLSETLKSTLADELDGVPTTQIVMTHYPQRSWLLVKVGSNIYCFNYTPLLGKLGGVVTTTPGGRVDPGTGSWSLFDGKLAQQLAFLVRNDGTLVCAGAGGKVYQFDQDVYSDDGDTIATEYQTPWLTMDEPKKSVNIKEGRYFQPVIDAAGQIAYTISVEAGYQAESTDTVTVTASGALSRPIGAAVIGTDMIGAAGIVDVKYPLRWRGPQARFTISTNDTIGPDVLSRFSVYAHKRGKR